MNKLRVLIVGGQPRNLKQDVRDVLDYTHIEQDQSFPNVGRVAPDVKAIVVITRFVGHDAFKKARVLSITRKIPLVQAMTGNYIIPQLVRSKLLKQSVKECPLKKVEAPPVPVEASLATGLSLEDLWKQYGEQTLEVLRATLKPGERVKQKVLLETLATEGGVGLPQADCEQLLPELAIRGILMRVSPEGAPLVWKYAVGVPYEPEPEPDPNLTNLLGPPPIDLTAPVEPAPEAPPKVRKIRERGTMDIQALLMAGLAEGPYPTKTSISVEMSRFKEFRKLDGRKTSDAYVHMLWPRLVKLGIVSGKPGAYLIKHDPEVKLTELESPKKVVSLVGKKATPKVIKEWAESWMEKRAQAEEAPPEGDVPTLVRNSFNGRIPWLGEHTALMKWARSVVPEVGWDEFAARTIARILKATDFAGYVSLKPRFEEMEWSGLAWQTLRSMPIEVLAPLYKPLEEYKDIPLTCDECGQAFVFVAGEQKWFQDHLGVVTTPRRCISCRKKRKADGLKREELFAWAREQKSGGMTS